jgi:hypothetical protein
MDVGRPKKNDFPPNMTTDGGRGGYYVRNPITGKRKRFADEALARKAAEQLAIWLEGERRMKALDDGRPTVAALVDWWKKDRMQFMPWDEGTRAAVLHKMARSKRELGDRILTRTDCLFLEEWLASFCKTADQFNKWRYALVLLWKFAVSRKLVSACEPQKIEQRSTSKKLAMNQKVRLPLDLAGFNAIHEKAPAWLQIAMEQSLVTLQARAEICNMRHTDYRDGAFIRDP